MSGPGAFRLILAFIVVIHHSTPLRMGALAVYLFFILSGYWISKMWDERYAVSRNPLLTFYVSRWWRLAPVFLLCTALGLLWTLGRGSLPPFRDGPFLWFLRQLPVAGSGGAGSVLPPAWSLDVEMQFYLLAPALIWLLHRLSHPVAWVAGGALFVLPISHFWRGGSADVPVLIPFLPFFVGGLLIHRTQWQPSRTMGVWALAAVVMALAIGMTVPELRAGMWIVGRHSSPPMNGVMLLWVVIAALSLPVIARNVHRASALLDRTLGDIAYPLYLFHWMPRECYYALGGPSRPAWQAVALLILNFTCAFGGAWMIYKMVDRPLDRLRSRWVARRHCASTAGVASAIVV